MTNLELADNTAKNLREKLNDFEVNYRVLTSLVNGIITDKKRAEDLQDHLHQYHDGCKDKCGACNLCCLSICKVCGLFEGALTTHCPKTVTPEQQDLVYEGQLNFRGGEWLAECSEHSPKFWSKRKPTKQQ